MLLRKAVGSRLIWRVKLSSAASAPLPSILQRMTKRVLRSTIRAGGERPFATYKSRYGLVRTRFMGLARNMTAYGIAAIAHNVRKGAKFLTRYGLPDQSSAGYVWQKPRNGV